jgi:gamma-glutamyltranspeptidase/glutathione hydrolase
VSVGRVERSLQPTDDGKSAVAASGIVSSAFPDATEAGVQMLAQGGNAVDAACAVAFALSVCEPQASGLGGQAVGLVHFGGRTFALDGSSRVPALGIRANIRKRQRRTGYKAATVPSLPAVYGWLHRGRGALPWADILAPAIRLAREGYRITPLQHDLQRRELKTFLRVPSASGARYFLKDGRRPYRAGDLFRQPNLADLLDLIARNGVEAFYTGEVAAQIDADMRANGGLIRADDLARIPWPVERRPLRRRYRNLLIASMPPPGAGRTLLLVMMMLNHLTPRFLSNRTPNRYHFLAETFRKAFLQRQDRPFDPGTYAEMGDKVILQRAFAGRLVSTISEGVDPSLPADGPPEVSADTTHLSVMDAQGNVASMTQSIELVYGAKAAAAGLGFLYNDYMLALEPDNPAHPYYLRPGAAPWSTATPTIVFREGRPWLALGSPGSERIFSAVSQFLVGVIDGSASIYDAMVEPRFHCSVGGTVSLEDGRFDPQVTEHLHSLGYRIDRREPYSFYLGAIQAVLKRQTGPGFQGVADVRRDGSAAGPGS